MRESGVHPSNGRLLTVSEVAGMLAVSERHVRDLVSRGAIRSVKVGRGYRFRTMWVQEFIDREENHGWPDGGDDRR